MTSLQTNQIPLISLLGSMTIIWPEMHIIRCWLNFDKKYKKMSSEMKGKLPKVLMKVLKYVLPVGLDWIVASVYLRSRVREAF